MLLGHYQVVLRVHNHSSQIIIIIIISFDILIVVNKIIVKKKLKSPFYNHWFFTCSFIKWDFFEVFEIIGTDGSFILILFSPKTSVGRLFPFFHGQEKVFVEKKKTMSHTRCQIMHFLKFCHTHLFSICYNLSNTIGY